MNKGENQNLNCINTHSTLQYRNCRLVKTYRREKAEIIEFKNTPTLCIQWLVKTNPLPFPHTSVLFLLPSKIHAVISYFLLD